MKFNQKLLALGGAGILLLLAGSFFCMHFLTHMAYLFLGVSAGMLAGKLMLKPKLVSEKIYLESCPLDRSAQSADGGACTVVVMRQYCYIIDTPSPTQVCYWVREEHQGQWNAQLGCCEAIVDGRPVCVLPR